MARGTQILDRKVEGRRAMQLMSEKTKIAVPDANTYSALKEAA